MFFVAHKIKTYPTGTCLLLLYAAQYTGITGNSLRECSDGLDLPAMDQSELMLMQRFDSTSSICSNKGDKFVEIMISHMANFDVQIAMSSEMLQDSAVFKSEPLEDVCTRTISKSTFQPEIPNPYPTFTTAVSSMMPSISVQGSRGQPKSEGGAKKRNWHGVCGMQDHRSFGRSIKSCRQCVSSSMTYNGHWCAICWRDGIRDFGAPTLVRFKTCRPHAKDYARKECPCGRRWTDCLDCRDAGVDPRAGTSFCGKCRKRFGAGKVDFCNCKERRATQ